LTITQGRLEMRKPNSKPLASTVTSPAGSPVRLPSRSATKRMTSPGRPFPTGGMLPSVYRPGPTTTVSPPPARLAARRVEAEAGAGVPGATPVLGIVAAGAHVEGRRPARRHAHAERDGEDADPSCRPRATSARGNRLLHDRVGELAHDARRLTGCWARSVCS